MLTRQKEEAMARMAKLTETFALNPNLSTYLEEGKLYYSYVVSDLFGCIDTIRYDERYEKVCRDLERRTGAFVYHAIETLSPFGTMLTVLYVSKNEGDWQTEAPTDSSVFAYVHTFGDDPLDDFGEYGDVQLTSDNGALLRIG